MCSVGVLSQKCCKACVDRKSGAYLLVHVVQHGRVGKGKGGWGGSGTMGGVGGLGLRGGGVSDAAA